MALGMKKPIKEQEENKTIEINAQMQGSLTFADPVNLKISGQFSGNLNTKGILTIGEEDGFCQLGGVISFGSRENRLVFEVNLERAKEEQIRIPARVLKHAKLM